MIKNSVQCTYVLWLSKVILDHWLWLLMTHLSSWALLERTRVKSDKVLKCLAHCQPSQNKTAHGSNPFIKSLYCGTPLPWQCAVVDSCVGILSPDLAVWMVVSSDRVIPSVQWQTAWTLRKLHQWAPVSLHILTHQSLCTTLLYHHNVHPSFCQVSPYSNF